jgi:hypothetical protein
MAENANEDVEEWESTVNGGRAVARWDDKGVRTPERVEGKAIFYVTPEERRRNESLARDQRDNPFKNGTFRMLRAVAGETDSEARLKASQTKSDEDLEALLDKPFASFEKAFKAIKEPVTVERLYTLGRKTEVGGNKMKLIMDTLKRMRPQTVLVGDSVGAGAEAPPDSTAGYRGPGGANIDTEIEGLGPRQYADIET